MKLEIDQKTMARAGFSAFTSIVCELLAFVFFFWADWRVGVGYCFIWLGEMNVKAAVHVARSGVKMVVDEANKKDDR